MREVVCSLVCFGNNSFFFGLVGPFIRSLIERVSVVPDGCAGSCPSPWVPRGVSPQPCWSGNCRTHRAPPRRQVTRAGASDVWAGRSAALKDGPGLSCSSDLFHLLWARDWSTGHARDQSSRKSLPARNLHSSRGDRQ